MEEPRQEVKGQELKGEMGQEVKGEMTFKKGEREKNRGRKGMIWLC